MVYSNYFFFTLRKRRDNFSQHELQFLGRKYALQKVYFSITNWSWKFHPPSEVFLWYPDDYESDGLYGRPIPSCHEDLYYESDSAAYWDWKANEYESTDQTCQDFMRTRSGDWLAEYISRFVGCWEDDTFSRGYGASNDGYSGLDMVDDPYREEERFDSYYNSDKKMDVQCGNEHNPWFAGGFGFQYGLGEDYGTEEHRWLCIHSWEEMELHDKIFGHWPCLLRTDLENSSETETI